MTDLPELLGQGEECARRLAEARALSMHHAILVEGPRGLGKSLAALGKLIGLLNLFLGMIGAPEVPDLSNLAGTPLDEVIPPIDAIIEALQSVRSAVPVP